MLVGLIIRHYGIITKDNEKSLSALVVNVGCPALIISSAAESKMMLTGDELVTTLYVVLATIIITVLFAQIIPMIMNYPAKERGAMKAMTIFNNVAFMGIPIILGVYGKDAVIYLTMFILPSNFLFFSYGIHLMQEGSEKSGFSLKKTNKSRHDSWNIGDNNVHLQAHFSPNNIRAFKTVGRFDNTLSNACNRCFVSGFKL